MKNYLIFTLIFVNLSLASQTFNYEREWATYFGGENTIVVDNGTDSFGNIYLTGYIAGTVPYSNQFMTSNSHQSTYGGGQSDGFIAKFSPDGLLVWATFVGGAGKEIISALSIDKHDNIYVSGLTSSAGMSTVGSYQPILNGNQDGLVSKFSPDGNLIWSTYYGGSGNDEVNGIACDVFGSVYFYGKTTSDDNISTGGSFQEVWDNDLTDIDGNDFVGKFTDGGSRLWATYYGTNNGTSNTSRITGISVSGIDFYVAGFAIDFAPTNYFATPGCYQPTNSNPSGIGADMFLSKFSTDGGRLWSTYYGGGVTERSVGAGGNGDRNLYTVACSGTSVYLTGLTNSPNNIATPGAFQTARVGYANFLARFNSAGERMWGTYIGNTTSGPSNGVFVSNTAMAIVDSDENIYVSGSSGMNDIASDDGFQPTINSANPGGGLHNNDAYVVRISSDGTTRHFGTYYGGLQSEQGSKTVLHTNGFYIIGTTYSNGNISSEGAHQEFLNSMAANPTPPASNAFIAKFDEIPLGVDKAVYSSSVIYPNPSNGRFYIRLNQNYIGSEIKIYDMQGKLIHEMIYSGDDSAVAVDVASGVCLMKVLQGSKLQYSCKLIIK